MHIKNVLFTMFIISSYIQAEQTSPFQSNPEPNRYLARVNQRFLLNGNKSLDKAVSYLLRANSIVNNRSRLNDWLIDHYTFQRWNSSSWINDSSQVYDYNQNNKVSELKIRDWAGSQWIDKARYLYQYDNSLRISMQTFQLYLSNSWNDSLQSVYGYNPYGLLDTKTTYRRNYQNWENYELMTSTYNTYQLIQDIYQAWNGGSWENSERTVYEYSQNSIDITFDIWLFETWINFLRIGLFYNANGYLGELKIQLWIPFVGWLNLGRSLFTYDNNYNIIRSLTQVWDTDISEWVDDSKITTTYNSENLPNTTLTEVWTANNIWSNDFFETFNYDEFLNRTEAIGQAWNGTGWANSERELFGYTGPTAVNESIPHAGGYKLIGNYPNPFNPSTTIQFYIPELSNVTLKIYDVTGEVVAVLINGELSSGTYNILWDARGVNSGIYFYQLTANGYTQTGKMILIK